MNTSSQACTARGSVYAVVAAAICATRPSPQRETPADCINYTQWVLDRDSVAYRLAEAFKDFDFPRFMMQTRL